MNLARKNPTMNPSFDLSVLKCFESIQIEDEPDIIVELIDLYREDAPRRFELMRSAISEGDRSEVQRQAHTVKGSSGNLGARGIVQICDRMERLESMAQIQTCKRLWTSWSRNSQAYESCFTDVKGDWDESVNCRRRSRVQPGPHKDSNEVGPNGDSALRRSELIKSL